MTGRHMDASECRPRIGVIGNQLVVDDNYPAHAAGVSTSAAVAEVCQCMPLLIPADPSFVSIGELMAAFDGFILTGGRPNIHPEEYGHDVTEAHGAFDRARDAITLPLVRACVERGMPILGICRGFQEVAVAMGSTLHPEIREVPGRMNHRMPPDGSLEEKFALRHRVTFNAQGVFHRLMGAESVMTNTLHGQAVVTPGPRFFIDGWAEDDTPEAAYVRDAPGFTLSVQWHPEWNAANDPVSRPLFSAFGDAARAWAARREPLPRTA